VQAQVTMEQGVWEGTPSQWINFKAFLLCGVGSLAALAGAAVAWTQLSSDVRLPAAGALLVLAVLLLAIIIKRYLDVSCTRYVVTSQRVRITTGILSTETNDTELYRVDDIRLEQPFWLRLVGRGDVVLTTSDRSDPNVVLKAVAGSGELRDQIRIHVEECRDRKHTRVMDMQ